ncbi:MAG: hypothetical protein ACJ78Z_16930 [Myxococcales bacterium]
MTAAGTIETLIRLGALVKDAARRPSGASSIDWGAFLASPGFAEIETAVKSLLDRLGEPEFQDAIRTIEARQRALVGDRKLSDLSLDDLILYSELGDVRLALTARSVEVAATGGFFGWLLHDALPVLLATAKTVIPLLV